MNSSSTEAVEDEYRSGGLRVASRLEPRPGADRMTVVLNAYCNRIDRHPPVFIRWPEGSAVFGHILRIADPTLFLTDWQRAGCYIGTETDNAVPPVVDCVRGISGKLGIPRHRIVYFGHSGAGFGAVQCAIHDGVSPGFGINSILEIEPFAKYKFASEIANIFRPGADTVDLCREFPERLSASAAVKQAHARGEKPCLAVLQNIMDRNHYKDQFRPFCKALGIGRFRSVDRSGLIRVQTYTKTGGHLAIPEVAAMEQVLEDLLMLRSAA